MPSCLICEKELPDLSEDGVLVFVCGKFYLICCECAEGARVKAVRETLILKGNRATCWVGEWGYVKNDG